MTINRRNAPELHVSSGYQEMLRGYKEASSKSKSQKEAVQFIKQKLDAAQWFIDDANGTKTGPLSNGTIVNGLQFVAPTTSGNVATARFAGGTNNLRAKPTCRITSAQGLNYERSITLPVRDR